ncbi:MAG: 6,7-dimethyl-8-ribityllumazine synthase [Pseudomonadota bacterium]
MNTNDKTKVPARAVSGKPVALVAAQWHRSVVDRLIEGARQTLLKAGLPSDGIELHWVPGSFELPQAVSALAKTGKYQAIIPIGCIVRGETAHFDFIAQSVFTGLDQVGRETGVAVSLAVLTVETLEQAIERAGGKCGNKGEEAADAALDLARLLMEARNGKPVARA